MLTNKVNRQVELKGVVGPMYIGIINLKMAEFVGLNSENICPDSGAHFNILIYDTLVIYLDI